MSAGQPRPIKYQFDADTKKFAAGARNVEDNLKDIAKTAVVTDKALDMDVDVDDGALTILKRRLIEARAQLERDIEIDVDLDATTALRRLNTLDRQIRQIDKQINIETNVDRDQIRSSLDNAVTEAQPAAQDGGGLLGLALAVGFGSAIKDKLVGTLTGGLKAAFEDAAGSAGALKDELDRMETLDPFAQSRTDFQRTQRQWALYEASARKISIARDRIADDELSPLFDREARAGMRAAGGISAISSAAASGGPYILAAGAALTALAAAAVGVGLAGGAVAGGVGVGGLKLLEGYDTIDKANRKARIVFGDNLKIMQDWAEGLSTNVGIGEKEIVAQSSAIQDLLVPQGFKRGAAAELTQSIYERGAALAEFSGLDTAQGVEAVNNALLGQRRQLKGLGVDITAKEVKERVALLKGTRGYETYNDKMLASAATLSLIEDKSADAWKAFNEGGSTADNVLDTLNSTLANFKTDAIEGFGGILNDIIRDLSNMGTGIEALEQIDLAKWIEENRDRIRSAMLEIVDLALLGADAFLQTARASTYIAEFIVKSVPDVLRFSAAMIDLTEKTGALFKFLNSPIGSTEFGDAWNALVGDSSDRVVELERSADELETRLNGFNLSGVREEFDGLGGKIDGFRGRVDELRELDAVRIAVVADLKEGSVDEAKAELATLSKDQLTALIASVDPDSASKTEKKLLSLAKKRLAKINTDAETSKTERELANLARDRFVTINIRGKEYNVPRYLARPDLVTGGGRSAMALPNRSAYARGGTDGAWLGGGTGYLAPRRQDQTSVNVYLDSKQIASYMQPAGSATEPRTRRP